MKTLLTLLIFALALSAQTPSIYVLIPGVGPGDARFAPVNLGPNLTFAKQADGTFVLDAVAGSGGTPAPPPAQVKILIDPPGGVVVRTSPDEPNTFYLSLDPTVVLANKQVVFTAPVNFAAEMTFSTAKTIAKVTP